LITVGGAFSHLVSDFGGRSGEKKDKDEEDEKEEEAIETVVPKRNIEQVKRLTRKNMGKAAGKGGLEVRA